MPLRTTLFVALIGLCLFGAPFQPVLGVFGYMGTYVIGPHKQWWHAPISHLDMRYSYTFAIVIAVGIALHWTRIRRCTSPLTNHEKLVLLFLGIVWISVLTSEATQVRSGRIITDHVSVKLTKILIFTFMLTHVVTDLKSLERIFWIFVLGALILGNQAYNTPQSSFTSGRLDTVGGPDFTSSNILSAFLAAMLPVIGVTFLRNKLAGRTLCVVAGGLAVNAIVLCRSRGSVVGLAMGAVVLIACAPGKYKKKIYVALIVAAIGALQLVDEGFFRRSSTITASQQERDQSAQARLDTWRASVRMLRANPLGVGAGNWYQSIGRFDARYAWRDAHNTFVRCYGELGIHGLVVFCMLIVSSCRVLLRARRDAVDLPDREQEQVLYATTALLVALATFLACGLFVTYLYIEALWWFLMLPVCVFRAVQNSLADYSADPESPDGALAYN